MNNSLYYSWVFIIGILITIVAIIWVSGLGTRSITTTTRRTESLPSGNWSKSQPTPGNNIRNQCRVYTFPAEDNGNGFFVPGAPVNDKNIIDNLQPLAFGSCLNEDQIFLKLRQRTCQGPQNCIGSDGNSYLPGQIETYYEECQANTCNGVLGLVALNVTEIDDAVCLTMPNVEGGLVTVQPCDVTNSRQVLFIERFNPDKTLNRGAGLYSRITDRQTGKCLILNGSNQLTLGDCQPNDGIVWVMAPPVWDCSPNHALYDPTNTTLAPVNRSDYKDNSTKPCYFKPLPPPGTPIYDDVQISSPQQLIYTPNLIVPKAVNAYELRILIDDPNLRTLVPTVDQTVIGRPVVKPGQNVPAVTAQIFQYNLFDILTSTQPCEYPFFSVSNVPLCPQ